MSLCLFGHKKSAMATRQIVLVLNRGRMFKQKHVLSLAFRVDMLSQGGKFAELTLPYASKSFQCNAITSDAINHNPICKCYVYPGITMRVVTVRTII